MKAKNIANYIRSKHLILIFLRSLLLLLLYFYIHSFTTTQVTRNQKVRNIYWVNGYHFSWFLSKNSTFIFYSTLQLDFYLDLFRLNSSSENNNILIIVFKWISYFQPIFTLVLCTWSDYAWLYKNNTIEYFQLNTYPRKIPYPRHREFNYSAINLRAQSCTFKADLRLDIDGGFAFIR